MKNALSVFIFIVTVTNSLRAASRSRMTLEDIDDGSITTTGPVRIIVRPLSEPSLTFEDQILIKMVIHSIAEKALREGDIPLSKIVQDSRRKAKLLSTKIPSHFGLPITSDNLFGEDIMLSQLSRHFGRGPMDDRRRRRDEDDPSIPHRCKQILFPSLYPKTRIDSSITGGVGRGGSLRSSMQEEHRYDTDEIGDYPIRGSINDKFAYLTLPKRLEEFRKSLISTLSHVNEMADKIIHDMTSRDARDTSQTVHGRSQVGFPQGLPSFPSLSSLEDPSSASFMLGGSTLASSATTAIPRFSERTFPRGIHNSPMLAGSTGSSTIPSSTARSAATTGSADDTYVPAAVRLVTRPESAQGKPSSIAAPKAASSLVGRPATSSSRQ